MTAPMTYNIEQAVHRIGPAITIDWLKKHIREVPHTRSGKGRGRAGRVAFTEAHLAEIVQMIEQRPESMPAPSSPEEFQSIVSRGVSRGVRPAS